MAHFPRISIVWWLVHDIVHNYALSVTPLMLLYYSTYVTYSFIATLCLLLSLCYTPCCSMLLYVVTVTVLLHVALCYSISLLLHVTHVT